MAMIDPNVMSAIGEALESHNVRQRPDEHINAALARALNLSETELNQWISALSEGCSVEEANRRVGLTSHRDEGLLNTIARAIGGAAGKIARP